MTGLRELRPHQVAGLDGLKLAFAEGCHRPLLQAPTGYGKTVIAAYICAGVMRKLRRVAFCVPSISLIDQTFERFVENGILPEQMGVIQADHPWRRPAAPIQICSAQTLARRELPDVDVVVFDEAHKRFAVYERWMADSGYDVGKGGESQEDEKTAVAPIQAPANGLLAANRRPKFIGLTATPWSKGLGRLFDRLIKPTSLQELIDLGYLSPMRVFAPASPDLSGVRTKQTPDGLDYDESQLAVAMDKPHLVADVVETWLQRGERRPTLCFATGRMHAQHIHERFERAGVKSAYVDANTPREERDEIGRRLKAGEIEVVCNIGVLTTGIDWDVRCIILARPTKSEQLFVQIIGRGLRTADGKADCIILDHSDTHKNLGMVTSIDRDELCDGNPKKAASTSAERKDDDLLPKCCEACTALMAKSEKVCLSCGWEFPKPIPIHTEDGELIEFDGRPGKKGGPRVVDQIAAMGKSSVFYQLNAIADERGYSDGWVAHKYKTVFGVWPRGVDKGRIEVPTMMLASWVRSQAIRWAKSNRNSNHGASA